MKKIIAVLLVSVLIFGLSACKSKEKSGLAFIGGPTGVEDRYEVQAVRTAVKEYCDAKHIPYFEYISDGSEGFYESSLKAAEANCLIAVCDSTASAEISKMSAASELSFLFVNYGGSGANSRSVMFCEEDAGFVAGYAAASDGGVKFGFLGGAESEMSRRYLCGFLQGLDAASNGNEIEVTYCFTGVDEASDEAQTIARDMFMSGCGMVFVCGGNIYKSAVQAANVTKKFLIGGEMDQAGESERFTTAAIKNYSTVLSAELDGFFENNSWREGFAGSSVLYRYSHGAVGIPTYTGAFRFENYTIDEFQNFAERLAADEFTVKRGTSIPLDLQHVSPAEYSEK